VLIKTVLHPSIALPSFCHYLYLYLYLYQSHSALTSTIMSPSNGEKRAPLTDEGKEIVMALRNAFKATDSAYCFSGHVPIEVKRPAIFYAVTPATFATGWTKDETPIPTG
jgi:hypothetical protein